MLWKGALHVSQRLVLVWRCLSGQPKHGKMLRLILRNGSFSVALRMFRALSFVLYDMYSVYSY